MAFAQVYSAGLSGPRVIQVQIEVDIQPGLPIFTIIGLPDKRIAEAKERVRSAIKNSGLGFPKGKITVNLSPAALGKEGTGFDLGIALAVLAASKKIPPVETTIWVVGELSLDGATKPISHLVPILLEAVKAKIKGVLIAAGNVTHASQIAGASFLAVKSLSDAVALLKQSLVFKSSAPYQPEDGEVKNFLYDQIVGQVQAKRALLIALSGGHNLVLTGPPGAGKTMLARAAQELLPPLSLEEFLEVRQIYAFTKDELVVGTPFRAPHHSLTRSGLLGSGIGAPGELSLAHRGTLFLDELPHFSRAVLESLRQPLEQGVVSLRRKGETYTYPAQCLVIAARNPCPCGLNSGTSESCHCKIGDLKRYTQLLSEPLLDRFSLFCEVPRVELEEVVKLKPQAREVKNTIGEVRLKQYQRLGNRLNSQMRTQELDKYCRIDREIKKLLKKAAERFYLSFRGVQNIRKVARTIADIEKNEEVTSLHFQEALQYRNKSIVF